MEYNVYHVEEQDIAMYNQVIQILEGLFRDRGIIQYDQTAVTTAIRRDAMFLNVIIAAKWVIHKKIVTSEEKHVSNAGNRDTLDGIARKEVLETITKVNKVNKLK